MDVTLDDPWAGFVRDAVGSGRYPSPDALVQEGLRLVRARDEKLRWLREKVAASIAEGGEYTDEEIGAYLDEVEAELSAGR